MLKPGWVACVAGLLLAGCNASTSDVGGGKLTATGCQSRISVGDQMRIRARWTAPKIARYTLIRLEGVPSFSIERVVDETRSRGRSNGVGGEYDLPGPQSPGTEKAIVALFAATTAADNAITLRVWGSGNAVSPPPDNAASVSCAVAVDP